MICLHISLVRVDQRAFRPGSQVAECRNQRLLMLTFALLKTFPCSNGLPSFSMVSTTGYTGWCCGASALTITRCRGHFWSRVRELFRAAVRFLICLSWMWFPEHTDRTGIIIISCFGSVENHSPDMSWPYLHRWDQIRLADVGLHPLSGWTRERPGRDHRLQSVEARGCWCWPLEFWKLFCVQRAAIFLHGIHYRLHCFCPHHHKPWRSFLAFFWVSTVRFFNPPAWC